MTFIYELEYAAAIEKTMLKAINLY